MADHGETTGTAAVRRRGPDPVALLIGLLTLGMALAAFTGHVPNLSGFDPRWLLAGGAAVLGLLLLLGSIGRRRR
ncbi:hypothetical protein [Pseudonocardia sp. GCM10023141]|uniref:hypothetical protein n=1 Tax=Pseudonocardia sp. GCM10023141 TaxID=3252653 RepID=UPI003611F309